MVIFQNTNITGLAPRRADLAKSSIPYAFIKSELNGEGEAADYRTG